MNRVSVKDMRDHIAEIVNRAAFGKERILVTRHGKNVAAIVPVEDVETMEYLEDQYDIAEVQRIRAEGGPTLSMDELKARLARKPGAAPKRGGSRGRSAISRKR
ncbi:MAG TPA: type II toxin-antitoxin system Phd/YefM family antitoxin [Terriglobia bacterium]|jgi:prevent-host-death family protein